MHQLCGITVVESSRVFFRVYQGEFGSTDCAKKFGFLLVGCSIFGSNFSTKIAYHDHDDGLLVIFIKE